MESIRVRARARADDTCLSARARRASERTCGRAGHLGVGEDERAGLLRAGGVPPRQQSAPEINIYARLWLCGPGARLRRACSGGGGGGARPRLIISQAPALSPHSCAEFQFEPVLSARFMVSAGVWPASRPGRRQPDNICSPASPLGQMQSVSQSVERPAGRLHLLAASYLYLGARGAGAPSE